MVRREGKKLEGEWAINVSENLRSWADGGGGVGRGKGEKRD